ncbi:unnamed protein product [Trichobilharzia regenti]|nr:unnamed protein product [Trichobilharzia regenti]
MNGYLKNSRPVEDSGSHDAVNTSLVSSGTDDTYDDATVGSQHLADSESFSHSALTPSSSRNPFKVSDFVLFCFILIFLVKQSHLQYFCC